MFEVLSPFFRCLFGWFLCCLVDWLVGRLACLRFFFFMFACLFCVLYYLFLFTGHPSSVTNGEPAFRSSEIWYPSRDTDQVPADELEDNSSSTTEYPVCVEEPSVAPLSYEEVSGRPSTPTADYDDIDKAPPQETD